MEREITKEEVTKWFKDKEEELRHYLMQGNGNSCPKEVAKVNKIQEILHFMKSI